MFILFHVIFSIHLNAISSVDQGDRFVYRKKVNQTLKTGWTLCSIPFKRRPETAFNPGRSKVKIYA